MQLPPQIEEAFALVAAGRARDAAQRLRALAARGDGPACYQLAEWHRDGEHVPRDFAAARAYYLRSGQAGLMEGFRRHIALLVTGVGGPRDWQGGLQLLEALAPYDPGAAGQLGLVRSMRLTDAGDPADTYSGEVLSESPRILRFPALFTSAECAFLAQAAEPHFEPAHTYNERTGEDFRNPVRTSDTAAFPWVGENPAVHALNRRIASASGTDVRQGEPLQVLRYAPGQEYRPHIDAIPGLDNQRILTVLVYLNDDYQGGETQFTQAELTVPPKQGDAILFHNLTEDGRPNPATVHAGLPVRSGVKFLASRWIRERAAAA